MRWIDRRLAGGEHEEHGGLGALEAEDDGVGLRGLHRFHVGVPVLARVDPELGGGLRDLANHVEGELDILRRERLAVVPAHVLAEKEHEVPVVLLPRPLLGQLSHHGVRALHALELIEHHEIVEAGQGQPHRGDGCRLVYGEADGELLPLHEVDHAARLGCLRHGDRRDEQRDSDHTDELHAASGLDHRNSLGRSEWWGER